jgi:putative DNA primase/helicase
VNVGRIERVNVAGVQALYDADPLDAVAVLSELEAFIERYVTLPDGACLPLAAWVMATHCFECFGVFPYLAITSPVPRCGKSTLLDLIGMLAHNVISASNISEAALFRTISEKRPVLVLDEAEWLRERSERAQIIRNILNAGHRANAFVIRSTKEGKCDTFSVFCPKAIAAIGELSDTLADRSIAIPMQRRAGNERSSRFRFENVQREAKPLQDRIALCMTSSASAIARTYESLGDLAFLDDRAADNWSPLFAVLKVIDPTRTGELKRSAEILSLGRNDSGEDSLPLRLLADFAVIAESSAEKVIRTDDLITGAKERPENPWAEDIKLTPHKAGKWLRGFGIRPVRTETYRGYDRKAILEAASRYLLYKASEASGSVMPKSHQDLRMTHADASDAYIRQPWNGPPPKSVECNRCGVMQQSAVALAHHLEVCRR